jgi:hypothetical protein
MYFDALLIYNPYVVRFDAPIIWCWMIRTLYSFIARMYSVSILTFVRYWLSWTLCSFAGRMYSVSDLASFDADHVSCYTSTGCKCFFHQCFLHRMLIFVERIALLQIARTSFWCSLLASYTRRWATCKLTIRRFFQSMFLYNTTLIQRTHSRAYYAE